MNWINGINRANGLNWVNEVIGVNREDGRINWANGVNLEMRRLG